MRKAVEKLASLVLAIVMVIGVLANPVFAVEEGEIFTDVPQGKWYHGYVMMLAERGFVKGFGDSGEFRPENKLTREQAAKMITLAASLNYEGKKADFEDVDPNSWASSYIAALKDKGVVKGFGDTGEFRPDNNIQRGHAAKMIGLAFDLQEGELERTLNDLPADVEVKEAIKKLASNGIVKGYGDTEEFRPAEEISRAEFSKILCIAMVVSAIQEAEAADATPEQVVAAQALFERVLAAGDLDDQEALAYLQGRVDALELTVLTVTGVSAIDETTLEVTLSDGSTVEQKLDTPLDEGENLVVIEYDGVTRKVTWTPEAPTAAEELAKAEADLVEAETKLEDAKADSKEKMVARISANKALDQANLDLEHAKKYGTEEEQQEAQAKVDEAQKAAEEAIEESNKAEEALEEAQGKVDALENEITGLAAEVAVEKAEGSFEQQDVDAAQKLVNVLTGPASAKKVPLNNRLEKVKETISLIEKAQEGINNLPEAKDVTLDHKVQIEGARGRVDILPEAAQDKLEHVDFLEAAEEALAKLVDEKAIAEAEIRVNAAENKKTQDAVDNAKGWVAKVKDEEAKKDFEDRLEAVQNAIDEAAAEAKVGAAEYYISTKDFIAAKTLYDEAVELVKALDEGEVKTDLEERLAVVKAALDQAEVDAMVKQLVIREANVGGPQWSITLIFEEININELDSLTIALYDGDRMIAEQKATEKTLTDLEQPGLSSPFYKDGTKDLDYWTITKDLLAGTPDKVVITFELDGETYTVESMDSELK